MLKDYSHHPFTVHVSLIITNAESGTNHMRYVHDVDTLTVNTEKCDAYTDVIIICSPKNVLCNYYMYPLKVFNTQFISAELTYQWRFRMYIGRDDHAHDILDARTPRKPRKSHLEFQDIYIRPGTKLNSQR